MRGKKLAIVLLAGAAAIAVFTWPRQSAHAVTPSSKTGVTIVAMGGSCAETYCFEPESLSIFQAQTVTWSNTTTVSHTVTICSSAACSGVGPGTGSDPTFNSGFISAGSAFSHQFHGTGTYNYYCMVHGYAVMHGTITVQAFAVKTSKLPAGTTGEAYSAKVKTDGGQSPFAWSIVSGSLPKGLKLSTSGRITGTPASSGTSNFKVKATDSSSPALTAKKALSITIG